MRFVGASDFAKASSGTLVSKLFHLGAPSGSFRRNFLLVILGRAVRALILVEQVLEEQWSKEEIQGGLSGNSEPCRLAGEEASRVHPLRHRLGGAG